jgi:hypothetical protein
MKNYSSKKAGHGKLAYRTPERFIYRKGQQVSAIKARGLKNIKKKGEK